MRAFQHLYTWMTPGESRAPFQGSRCSIQTHVRNWHHCQCSSVPVLVFLVSVIIALAFPALILSLTVTLSVTLRLNQSLFLMNTESESSLMVVCYCSCMACAGGPTYLTTYKCAVIHYARSAACNQFQRNIATVALCNSPADRPAWTQAYLGLSVLGCGLDCRKMHGDVGIVLAPALQVTEIARSYVSYMIPSSLSWIHFINDLLFKLG